MRRHAGLDPIDTAALKRERRLEDVVAAYGIALRRSGAGRYWALCPFHQERAASFCVDARDPEDVHFHCFSCAAHGDVIDFVMRLEGCSFSGACERLSARRRPPALQPVRYDAVPSAGRRWDLISPGSPEDCVLELAAQVFAERLETSPRAQHYLDKRGVPLELARVQRVGYADGRSLLPALRRLDREECGSGGAVDLAQQLGLVVSRPSGEGDHSILREFFFDRLVIPELRGGRPIWFIGRTIDDSAAGSSESSGALGRRPRPKYLSLPGERPILGLEHVLGRSSAYLVEGPFDWLAAIGWHLPAFAICGTHVPIERLPNFGGAVAIYGVFRPRPRRAQRRGAVRAIDGRPLATHYFAQRHGPG